MILCFRALLFAAALAGVLAGPATADEADAISKRLDAYLDAFNTGDAEAVAGFWAEKAVSLDEETGERVVGRAALLAEFQAFFKASPGAKLTGKISHVRFVRPEVAVAEGEATLFIPDTQPTASAFTAVLVKEGGQWMLESSQERELPTPATPADALEKLAWLVGDWQDETDGVDAATTVRWSPSKAFLLRSYRVEFADGELFEGTQIIGWDPRRKQFRTWSFNSDGSFGEGIASSNGEDWMLKMTHVRSDGGLDTATQIITRVDADTLKMRKIGRTVDGAPAPASDPVTVVRVETALTSTEGGQE